ncbi:MAG: DUF4442 domain-containing protein [Deltaproteobacteria bacterium]|nr:DUF4442 domain-containing protein [Deltaproteobacteria bacterium]
MSKKSPLHDLAARVPLLGTLQRATVADIWALCQRQPMGKALFSRLLALRVPYSGALGADVEELSNGHARVTLRDRRSVRNHLDSIHAVALANLGELTTGIALLHAIDGKAVGIVTHLGVDFLKKARGTLTSSCDGDIPDLAAPSEFDLVAEIRDHAGEVVCRVRATWSLRPVAPK